jgi:Flp pilus assembly protein TadG
MMRFLSQMLRDRAGNVTIELALLAPILGAMLIGLIDISTAYSDKLRLEQVAQRTVERVMQKSFVVADVSTLETEAEAASGAGSNATVTYWLECNAAKMTGASAYTTGCATGEQYARYVQVEITKDYTPMILSSTVGTGMNGNITLTGKAGIRIQ